MNEFTELDELSFDVPYELGEVVDFHKECPGVYYIATNNEIEYQLFNNEYYVVTDEATMISQAARSYGEQFDEFPFLLFYDLGDTGSGKYIIEYEILLYKIQNKLPLPEDRPIQEIEAFGREMHPDYFGAFSVPKETPWGRTVRHNVLTNGLYWITTSNNQKTLAVCYPMQDDLSSTAAALSRLTDYDAGHGLDTTMGYMFFSEKDSCIPLFELLEPRAEWQNCINIPALMNAIFKYHPDYAVNHNAREMKGLNDYFGRLINSIYADYELQGSEDNLITICAQAGTKFLDF